MNVSCAEVGEVAELGGENFLGFQSRVIVREFDGDLEINSVSSILNSLHCTVSHGL